MKIRLSEAVLAILLATGLLILPTVTYSQEKEYKFQLTPFAGYRFGGTFEDRDTGQEYELSNNPSYGLILNFPSRAPTEWEIYYSRQTTELDVAGFVQGENVVDMQVDYLQLGGTYLFDGSKSAVPYFVATAGLTRMDPDAAGTKSDTFFSFGVGGGWKYFPASRVGLRLDGRLLGTFVDSNSSIFCQSGQSGANCVINTSGKILYQFELQAGIIFRF
jgi:opacity protein-like surface antigen